MFQTSFKALCIYCLISAIILGWWYLAFHNRSSTSNNFHELAIEQNTPNLSIPSPISIINRQELQEALGGNTSLMTQLIAEWDTDAQLLEDQNQINVKRLPRPTYLRSQLIGRQLSHSSPIQLEEMQNAAYSYPTLDDIGTPFHRQLSLKRFLPQTYVAASILLALADPAEISALPMGLREQTHIFPVELTSKIPIDIDRYHSEQLYLAQPQIAFVTHYSDPSVIEALRNQGMLLFTMRPINSIPEIGDALVRIGTVINRPLKAELLAIFIEAALLSIDNQMMLAKEAIPPRILYLNYHAQYSVPTLKTLTGQLLQRIADQKFAEIFSIPDQQTGWTIPIDQEKIVNFNPDCMIIAAARGKNIEKQISNEPAFAQLPAIRKSRIFCVDESVQQFPSQLIVLAYYDIAQAINSR